jgi:hypothetical protein
VTNVKEVAMNFVRFIRRAMSFTAAVGGTMLGFALFAPSAFALLVRPIGDGPSSAVAPPTAPATSHYVVQSGMAGWEIAIIALVAALLSATVAVFADRALGSNRKLRARVA